MPQSNTLARTLHEVGLAAWFGGSLMGAVGLNGAAAEARAPAERARVADAGWARWTPVNALAIGAHLVGALQLTRANKGRMMGQSGVMSAASLKTGLTLAALGATAYARALGQQVMEHEQPVAGATEPAPATSPEVADAQRKLKLLQWAVPMLTGAVLVINSRMGEQQRPKEVVAGMAKRFMPRR